nr:hypothetical protein BaRGS_033630 [Batillaria attramentaria]
MTFPNNHTQTTADIWNPVFTDDDLTTKDSTSHAEYIEYQLARWLLKIYRPVCSVFGLAGNILSIVVFMTTSLRHSPTAIYMVTLAALDWVISLYAGLHLLPMIFVGEERFFTESWHCRAYYFIFLFVVHFDTLTLVSMTAQRYRGRCNVGSGIGQYVQMRVYPWIDSVLYFFFPTVTISVLNVLIFLALKKADNFKRQAGVTGPEHGANSGWQGDRFSASKTVCVDYKAP